MTIEQLITLRVGDLSAADMFRTSTRRMKVIEWERGGESASITAVVDMAGYVPFVVLTYNINGRSVRQSVTLRWHSLYNGGGFYYFICPVSGMSCRNLYYSEERGGFVGRAATGAVSIKHLRKAEREALENSPYRWQILRRDKRAVTI